MEEEEESDRQQESGGSETRTKTIQLTANQGTLRVSYNMFDVPDRLKIEHEGKILLDTQEVSGSDTLSIPFSGKVARVTVTLIGNEISSTKWNYTLSCPIQPVS